MLFYESQRFDAVTGPPTIVQLRLEPQLCGYRFGLVKQGTAQRSLRLFELKQPLALGEMPLECCSQARSGAAGYSPTPTQRSSRGHDRGW